MRIVIMVSPLLLVSPVFGELTKEDLRTIIREEGRPIIKEEITASEKRVKEYIDLKIETVNTRIDATNARIDAVEKKLNGRMDDIWCLMLGLFGLVAAAIAVPQIIMAYRDKGQQGMQSQIDQPREQLEAMQSTPS